MNKAAKLKRRAPSVCFKIEQCTVSPPRWRWSLAWADDNMPIASSDRRYTSYRSAHAAVQRLVTAIVQWACEETPF